MSAVLERDGLVIEWASDPANPLFSEPNSLVRHLRFEFEEIDVARGRVEAWAEAFGGEIRLEEIKLTT